MYNGVIISGEFLLRPINGIPRYAMEILKRIDEMAVGMNISICYPSDIEKDKIPELRFIKAKPLGKITRGWDEIYLARFCRKEKALLINLASRGTTYRDSIICIHDIRPLTWDIENKVKLNRNYVYKLNFYLATHSSKKIITDSNFSKTEIIKRFNYKKDIEVIPCGWEHINEIIDKKPQNAVAEKNTYYFTLGSVAPHKNFEWIIKAARYNRDSMFIVAGGIDTRTWDYKIDLTKIPNIRFLGYISEENMKWYMKNAKALIFPSYYEGFGIPPLEALSMGVPVISSDIPVMKEIYGNSVHYIDPNNSEVNLEELLKEPTGDVEDVLKKNSWNKSAQRWMQIIKENSL